MTTYDIVIGYSFKDIDQARHIKEKLESRLPGIKICFEEETSDEGRDLSPEFVDAVRNTEYFYFIMSNNSIMSPRCQDELTCALEMHDRLIPIELEGTDIKIRGWMVFNCGRFDWVQYDDERKQERIMEEMAFWRDIPFERLYPDEEKMSAEDYYKQGIQLLWDEDGEDVNVDSDGYHLEQVDRCYDAFLEGAKLGDVNCMLELAENFYLSPENKALLYRKAAEVGNAEGIYGLGVSLLSGNGVEKSPEKGVSLLIQAAELEFTDALYELGKCYAEGIGIEKDTCKASNCFTQYVEKGKVDGNQMLEIAKFHQAIGDANTDDWYIKAALLDNKDAMFYLAAKFYHNGKEGQKRAFHWCKEAADHGHLEANKALARSYQNGEGLPQDYSEAIKYYFNVLDDDAYYWLNYNLDHGFGSRECWEEIFERLNVELDTTETEEAKHLINKMEEKGISFPK